jgi:hypothetical protein
MITEDLEGVVGAVWSCDDCGWKNEAYRQLDNGEGEAYYHAKNFGHTVCAEIVTMRKIVGKLKESK